MENYSALNLNRICRICLNEYPIMKQLFQDNLAEILHNLTALQVLFFKEFHDSDFGGYRVRSLPDRDFPLIILLENNSTIR